MKYLGCLWWLFEALKRGGGGHGIVHPPVPPPRCRELRDSQLGLGWDAEHDVGGKSVREGCWKRWERGCAGGVQAGSVCTPGE